MNQYYENELTHHGVKGMKWGVRKKIKTAAVNRRKSWSDDSKEAFKNGTRRMSKQDIRKMSNSDLKKLNERLQLEQRYDQLRPNKINKGVKYLASAAAIMGTGVALYNNTNTLYGIGKNFVGSVVKGMTRVI